MSSPFSTIYGFDLKKKKKKNSTRETHKSTPNLTQIFLIKWKIKLKDIINKFKFYWGFKKDLIQKNKNGRLFSL